MERDTATMNASMQKAAQNLQEAIMSVRKARQSHPVVRTHRVDDDDEMRAHATASVSSRTATGKTRASMWLQDEYLESSDSEMDDDVVSLGSTMSDDDAAEDNQLSACSSPTKSIEKPQDDREVLDASSTLLSTKDSSSSTADPPVHSMIDQMKSKMDELAQLKATIMHTFLHACSRVDAFVSSTTGHARAHVGSIPSDLDDISVMVSRWDRELAGWKARLSDDMAEKCRHEVLHIQRTSTAALQQQRLDQLNRVQMAMEDNSSASMRWQDRLSAECAKAKHERHARKLDALARKRAEEKLMMAAEDGQSRLALVHSQLEQTQKQVEAQDHANAMLRLQLTSIDTRLEEALKQVHIEQEIARHMHATQQHEMREIEALNYKLLNTLVQQDENLQLKEAAMHQRLARLDADRAQLADDQVAFELHKNLILKDLKGVCDYFAAHGDNPTEDDVRLHMLEKVGQYAHHPEPGRWKE